MAEGAKRASATTLYYTYLLRCEGGELYAGITTDLERRFEEHASGGPKGAKYTRTHRPVRIESSWEMPDKASASALEYRLKRLTHAQKEKLAADPAAASALVAQALARASAPRVLMLGNSLSTSRDLPDLLAKATGGEVIVHARGGARLSEHLNPKTRLGSLTQAALAAGGWTHVVLQERSDGPVRYQAAYLRAASALCEQVRAAGAVPVVYATWAYAPGCAKLKGLGLDHAEMHAALQSAFEQAVAGSAGEAVGKVVENAAGEAAGNSAGSAAGSAAGETVRSAAGEVAGNAAGSAAVLANVGAAFFDAGNEAQLYVADGVHPSTAGAALAAKVLAATICR